MPTKFDLDLEAILGKTGTSLDKRKYLDAVREYWWLVLLTFVLATAAAVIYVKRTTPVYQSRAVLMVEERQTNIVNMDAAAAEDMMDKDMIQTMVESIQSRTLDERVVDSLNLLDDKTFLPTLPNGQSWTKEGAIGFVENSVKAVLRQNTRLIDITAENTDPEKARILADTVAKEFIRMGIEQHASANQMAYQFLTEEVARLGDKVKKSEEAMQEYRVQNNAESLEENQNLIVDRLKDLNDQLGKARADRMRLEADVAAVKDDGDNVNALLQLPSVAALPSVSSLVNEVAQSQADFELIQQRYRQLHPAYIAAQTNLLNLQNRLSDAVKNGSALLSSDYERAKAAEARLSDAVADQEKQASDLSEKAIEYNALNREFDANTVLFNSVLSKAKETDLTKGLDESPVKFVESAVAASVPVRPKVTQTVGMAAASGLIFGVAGAIGIVLLSSGIKTVHEAETALKLPVLSAVPERDKEDLNRFEILNDDPSLVSESIRSLRTSVNLLGPRGEKKKIIVTSALPGEGKTYMSCSLAIALAQSGQRTLLVDADLRIPSISRAIFGKNVKPGLTDVLAGQAAIQDAIVDGPIENLRILTAGSNAPNPSELMSEETFAPLMDYATEHFDRIVIDTAPVLAVSDTLSIARASDLICLVVQSGKTPRGAAERAIKLLGDIGRTPAGLILNRFSLSGKGYSYAYYYGHYGRKEASDLPKQRFSVATVKHNGNGNGNGAES